MRTRFVNIGKGIVGLGVAAAVLLGSATPVQAAILPFTDPSATASIGLCDAQGNPITSGSLDAHAFVTAAAASSAAPDGYGVAQGGKATLYAFQPRQGADPGEWTGFELTGGSVFSDDAHPLISGTNIDPSLREFLSAFPARWDGLVELRIYYSAPNKVVVRDTYPAAVLKVAANTWTLVQGSSSLHCDLHKVISSERILLPAAAFDPNRPAVTHPPAPAGAPTASTSRSVPSPSRPAPSDPNRGAATASASTAVVADTSTKSGTTSSTPIWWGLAAVVVLGAAGALARRRRRTR